jgi:hypothetical protein
MVRTVVSSWMFATVALVLCILAASRSDSATVQLVLTSFGTSVTLVSYWYDKRRKKVIHIFSVNWRDAL